MKLTRRRFTGLGAAALASAVLATPSDAAGPSYMQLLYDAAKREGSVTWWTAHYAQDAAERVRAAFVKKYPGIEVLMIRQTAQVIYERLQLDLRANVHELDVFASTDEAHYPALQKQGVLATFRPPDLSGLPEAFHSEDKLDQYHTGALRFVGLVTNTRKLTTHPRQWRDLTDPKYKGQITIGHPGFSGVVGAWAVAMQDKYGWDFFTRLAANDPKIGRSVNDTVTDIVSGERSLGAGPDAYAFAQKAKGNPIDFTFPDGGAVLVVSPVAVLKDAPHPNAARLFENFYYSREYGQAMLDTYNFPLRSDMPGPGGLHLRRIRYIRNTQARLASEIPEITKRWRQTFGI